MWVTGGATLFPLMRLALFLAALVLALAAPAAVAQQGGQGGQPPPGGQGGQGGGGGAFGPLPPPSPAETPTPTPDPRIEAQQGTDRTLLYIIGGGLVVLFVIIARVITSDARKALREQRRAEPAKLRDEGAHRHKRQAKAKARAKGRAQRAARRQNR